MENPLIFKDHIEIYFLLIKPHLEYTNKKNLKFEHFGNDLVQIWFIVVKRNEKFY